MENHAKSLSAIVQKLDRGFSEAQMKQLESLMRDSLGDAGLRIDEPDHVDAAREDFRFLRKMRKNWEGAAMKVGGLVLTAGVVLVLSVLGAGFWAWLGRHGG